MQVRSSGRIHRRAQLRRRLARFSERLHRLIINLHKTLLSDKFHILRVFVGVLGVNQGSQAILNISTCHHVGRGATQIRQMNSAGVLLESGLFVRAETLEWGVSRLL